MATTVTPVRILNCLQSKDTENDWVFDTALEAGMLTAPPKLPSSKDLREPWWTVGDQGSTGSCVGWAAADSVLRWHFTKAGRMGEDERLSPRFIWMAAKETDEFVSRPTTFIERDGTSLKAALTVARKYGAVPDKVLPFEPGELYGGDARTFYAIAARLRIVSYFNLGRNLDKWRTWLATSGPILTRLNVDKTWYEALANKGKLDVYQKETAGGGHAAALVGYTPEHFIVRNSWGAELWGDRGFGYASNDYAREAFTEAYGVSV
jgi:hypothetical protein